MPLNELITKFLTITGYDKDDNILAIIFHGSRVTGNERPNSDLDVVVISQKSNNYKKGFLIDNIRVDCHIYSINDIYNIMHRKKDNNNTFLESILTTGLVVKNKDWTIEILKDYSSSLEPSIHHKAIPDNILEDIKDLYTSFNNSHEFYYYNLLEKIRIAFNYLYGCSYLGTAKVYEIFNHPEVYQNRYLIKLPNPEFITLYLKAITAKPAERPLYLQKLISILHLKISAIKPSTYYNHNVYYSKDRIKEDILTFHNKLLKTIDMLLINHPYSKMMYAILLQSMYEYYYKINYEVNPRIEELYNEGINEIDSNQMINIITEFFNILSQDYIIDYDNYLIRLELVN